jgi:hypothetical protein
LAQQLPEGLVGVTRRVACALGCTAALAGGFCFDLDAQEVRVRSRIALYTPTKFSLHDGTLHIQQKIGVTVGARMTLTFNERLDVVTGVTYNPGYALVHGAGKRIDVGTVSHSLSGSTGARYWLVPPKRNVSWEVHTGLGVVFGGQPAFQDLFESSTLSGILGTTVRYQIGQIVSLQMKVQERLFRFRFGGLAAGRSSSPLQVSFGVGFPFLESLR